MCAVRSVFKRNQAHAKCPQILTNPALNAVNIDTGSLYNGMDFADPKFRTLVAQLGPSIIRIGGTAVDSSFYFPDAKYLVGQPNPCAACGKGAAAIGDDMLRTVFDFIAATDSAFGAPPQARTAKQRPHPPAKPLNTNKQ